MNFNLKGKIEKILPVKQISPTFSKQEIVIKYKNNGKEYLILLVAFNRQIQEIEKFKEGEEVLVSFEIQGRKWISPKGVERYINNLVITTISNSGSIFEDLQEASLTDNDDNWDDIEDLPF